MRTENRDQRTDDHDRGRDPRRHAGPPAQAEDEKQHAPESRHQHVDELELRRRRAVRVARPRVIRRPGTANRERNEADPTETRKGQP